MKQGFGPVRTKFFASIVVRYSPSEYDQVNSAQTFSADEFSCMSILPAERGPAMSANTDFELLFARLRTGDDEAARELLAQYEDAIRRYVRVRLTDPALRRQMDSMDVCQSVMADFFVRSALGQFELQSPEQLIALLATMARNRLINHANKQHAERRDVRRLEGGDVAEFQPAHHTETPSLIVANQELLTAFRARLKPDERELAERRALGQSWEEIACDLGGKPDACRVRLARAIERVSAELGLDSSTYE